VVMNPRHLRMYITDWEVGEQEEPGPVETGEGPS